MALLKETEFRSGSLSLVIDTVRKRTFPIKKDDGCVLCHIFIRKNSVIRIIPKITDFNLYHVSSTDQISQQECISIVEIAREMMIEFGLRLDYIALEHKKSQGNITYINTGFLSDYWIGADSFIYKNEERKEMVEAEFPIIGNAASPVIPYQSESHIHDSIVYDDDEILVTQKKYGTNLLFRKSDDFDNSSLRIDKREITITLHSAQGESCELAPDEMVKLPKFEINERLMQVELTINNHLETCNPIDLSSLPKNVSIKAINGNDRGIYNKITDWEHHFGGIARSLETYKGKSKMLPISMFNDMIHQSKAEIMKANAIKKFGVVEAQYLPNSSPIILGNEKDRKRFLSYIYHLGSLFCVALPKTRECGQTNYLDPTISNFIALQKGYYRLIHKMTKTIIERDIETEKRKSEYKIKEGKRGRKEVKEALRNKIDDIKSRNTFLFAVKL